MAKKVYLGIENPLLRPLPSGYTQIEYIQGTGTQYIDTGFYPNQDTGVTMDFEVTDTSATSWLFCGRTAANNGAYGVYAYTGGSKFYFVYGANQTNFSGNTAQRQICTAGQNQCTIDGTTVTITAQTFTSSATLCLLARNTGGTVAGYAKAKLYSCKIYDNGTLIHDYVPCLNADGVAGLYDLVDGVFCTNAGTGSFGAGAAYHSHIARELKKIYLGDENNLARMIKKAYLGDDNGIARQVYPDTTALGSLAVGSSVYMNVGGAAKEFIVVHQGLPSSVYDSSCNGTWLLMKEIYGLSIWNSDTTSFPNYRASVIDAYLQSTFQSLLDADVLNIIKTVKIYSRADRSDPGSAIARKIFLLSANEVDCQNSLLLEKISGVLDYFQGASDSLRQAYFNGTATEWWLRSIYGTSNPTYVRNDGAVSQNTDDNEFGVRPAMILPSNAYIDGKFNIIT